MMRFISKNRKAILPLIPGLCLVLCSLTGCKEEAPPAQPAVVKKRIEPPASQPAAADKGQAKPAAETAQTQPEQKKEPAVEPETPKPAAGDAKLVPAPPMTMQPETAGTPKTGASPPAVTEAETAKASEAEMEETADALSLKESIMDSATPKYDPTGKTDPFAALFSKESAAGVSEDTEPKRPLTPLEKIDLSQLQLVAVISASSGSRAMVEDATGKGYVLMPGTFVGLNSGVVMEILKDRVIIEEKTKDFLGRESTGIKELKLQKPFGEQ